MGYNAYELQSGEVLSRVEFWCKDFTTMGHFTDSSPVNLAMVEQCIDDAYYYVGGQLTKHGLSAAQSGTAVVAVLRQIQAVDAAVQVEQSSPSAGSDSAQNRQRGLLKRRDELVSNYLATSALVELGATANAAATRPEITGRSQARKTAVYGDSDIVPARFRSGYGSRQDTRTTRPGTGADPNQV